MLFKLLMPSVDRLMKGGVVAKWHKKEGDHVDYGDDIVDVRIEYTMNLPHRSIDQVISHVIEGASLRDKELANISSVDRAIIMVSRLTSSDVGVLRRIDAREGAYVAVGSVVAVLSTEDHGVVDEDMSGATEFRIVANMPGYF